MTFTPREMELMRMALEAEHDAFAIRAAQIAADRRQDPLAVQSPVIEQHLREIKALLLKLVKP